VYDVEFKKAPRPKKKSKREMMIAMFNEREAELR
jgi:hypothetical protein